MTDDIEILKKAFGYEIRINGKLVRLHRGSGDARVLYEEIKRSYHDLSRQLEFDSATRERWRKITAGTASQGLLDALAVMLEIYFRKRKNR